MRLLRPLFIITVLLALALPMSAQSTYILTVSPANVDQVLASHGLTIVKELHDGSNCIYLVSSASADVNGTEVEVEKDLLVLKLPV